jgi:predicted NBD/HSP70 family sugar kinase
LGGVKQGFTTAAHGSSQTHCYIDRTYLMPAKTPNKLQMLGVEDVRETNELKLLHVIRDRQPISRADLVKATGLRAGTVSVIVNRLIRNAAIHEGAEAPSSGGRPATYLQVNAERAYIAGLDIGVRQTIYGIGDFNGRIISQRTVHTDPNAHSFLVQVSKLISSQLKTSVRRVRLAGVGVSVPGLIDREDGYLVTSPNLGWRDVPIRTILEKELDVPVHVENDANAAALSELWYGPMDLWSAHCMLFVLVVEGIGTGLILDGEVYGGSRIGLGGFGHISMDPNGPPCSCGNIGCLEALASDQATLKRFSLSRAQEGAQVKSMDDLVALAQSGNVAARAELITTATCIGRGIKGLAHGLAPEIIVIGGQITAAWSIIEPTLTKELQGEYLIQGISMPQLRTASVEQPSFFGAFPTALRYVLHKGKTA